MINRNFELMFIKLQYSARDTEAANELVRLALLERIIMFKSLTSNIRLENSCSIPSQFQSPHLKVLTIYPL